MLIKEIDFNDFSQVERVKEFLRNEFNMGFDDDTEYTLILEDENEIMATSSFSKNIIKQVAIKEKYRGQGYASVIMQKIIDKMIDLNIMHIFVFTKPVNLTLFKSLGFKKVASVYPDVIFLEWGNYSIEKHKNSLIKFKKSEGEKIGSLVMNCNPFTIGHRYLIEKASNECDYVYVFVLEEDRSVFSFDERIKLVLKGVEDLDNVVVLKGGKYIISSTIFPSYFSDKDKLTTIQTELDAEIFGSHISRALNINIRYIGNEPYCSVTNTYNKSLKKILPRYGIKVVEVERKASGREIISAKKVREGIKSGDWDLVLRMVPSTTFKYLKSKNAEKVIEKIENMNSRH